MRGQSRLPLRVIALLVLVGCGEVVHMPDADTLDPNRITSGTRLKVRWYDYGGDVRATSGLFDAQRGESCFNVTWSDGKIYCVPSDTGQSVYLDKQCTQLASLVGRSTCGAAPAGYLLEFTPASCTSTAKRLFQRGPQVTAMEYYVPGSNGTCVGPFTDADATYYLPGTEVPVTQLVELSLDAPDRSVRLSAPAYTSADGARFRTGMYDSQLDTRCFVSSDYAGAGTGVCAPSSAASVSFFRDATCSLPVVDEDKACPAPQFARKVTDPACPSSPTVYHRVGEAVALQAVYAGGPGSCFATTIDPQPAFYALGEVVSLPEVSRVRDPANGGTLQVIRYVSGGLTFRDGSLYDNKLGAECHTRLLADGSYRCIPSTAFVQQFFTNATCTQAIDLIELFTGPASCGAHTVPAFAAKSLPPPAGSCVPGLEIHAVGMEYTGPLFQNFGMCSAAPTGDFHHYRLGALLPLAQFQPATAVTDP